MGIDKWLYSPTVKAQRRDTPTDTNPYSHGSCVLSKVIGLTNGVYKNRIGFRAKNSRVVVVKFNPNAIGGLGEILWAFSAIRADILNNRRAEPAVIAYPWTAYNADPIPWSSIKGMIQEIFNLGGTVIVPSGNAAENASRSTDVDTLPAMWATANFPLIVVGSVDNTGTLAPFSQGPTHVTIWAPGVDVQCARRFGFRIDSGTSYSTGMVCHHFSYVDSMALGRFIDAVQVAGLVAYTLALQQVPFTYNIQTPLDLRDWLVNTASWVR